MSIETNSKTGPYVGVSKNYKVADINIFEDLKKEKYAQRIKE